MVDRPLQQSLSLLLRRQIGNFFDLMIGKLGGRSRLRLVLLQLHPDGKLVPSAANWRRDGRSKKDQNHGQAENYHQALGPARLEYGRGILGRHGWRIVGGLAAHSGFCSISSLST